MARKIRVLVIDDSALIRQMITAMLERSGEIEVVGTAADPLQARALIKSLAPDVLTLDVEMPHMDGLAFLEKLMALRPMPVIMVSTLTARGADTTLRALELGALDVVAKPGQADRNGLGRLQDELVAKIRAAAGARLAGPRPAAHCRPAHRLPPSGGHWRDLVIAIGASTGGVAAIAELLAALPAGGPPVVITQHMPPDYTERFAARLDQMSALRVAEARDGAALAPGLAYVAPGGRQLALEARHGRIVCSVQDGAPVSGHKPSVDVLMRSAATAAGAAAIGVLLTGMGRDGAQGLLAMRQAGALTIGQDQASSVVYGMPRAAKELGAVMLELPLGQIGAAVLRHCASPSALRAMP
jgi:two-component system chemotaxis response regulator CheB